MASFPLPGPQDDEQAPETAPMLSHGGSKPPGGGGGLVAAGQGDGASDNPEELFEAASAAYREGELKNAMGLWLSGLRYSPASMRGLEGFFQSTAAWLGDPGRCFQRVKVRWDQKFWETDLAQYLRSLMEWGMNPTDPRPGIRCAQLAARAGVKEHVAWIGMRAGAEILRCKNRKHHATLCTALAFAYEQGGDAGEARRWREEARRAGGGT